MVSSVFKVKVRRLYRIWSAYRRGNHLWLCFLNIVTICKAGSHQGLLSFDPGIVINMLSQKQIKELISFAHQVADEVGKVHCKYFRQPISTEYKDDSSPVTQVDKEAETVVRNMVMKQSSTSTGCGVCLGC
jgi:hypothetical protein